MKQVNEITQLMTKMAVELQKIEDLELQNDGVISQLRKRAVNEKNRADLAEQDFKILETKLRGYHGSLAQFVEENF